MTFEVDFPKVYAMMNMQLSVYRAPGAGPLSVVQIVMVGEIEEVTL